MNLGALLSPERVLLPLDASGVEEGFRTLAALVVGEVAAPSARGSAAAPAGSPDSEVEGGRTPSPPPPGIPPGAGEGRVVHAPSPEVRLAVVPGMARDVAALGVTPVPVHGADGPGEEGAGAAPPATPQILLLLGRGPEGGVSDEGVDRLLGLLARPEVVRSILRVSTAEQLLGLHLLMNTSLSAPLRVADAVTPTPYRVYPDAPLGEVLDLMARKGVSAIPVVGESHEVMGILTAGDGLRLLLERRGRVEVPAREVMTRAVLCVTEDQELEEAARLMVNRNLRQLPVVREGEIVGFLTRERVLRALLQGRGGGEESAAP